MNAVLRIRPMVMLPLRDHTALAEHYLNHGEGGGVFVPGYTHLSSGTNVDLEIVFAREQLSIYSHGVVRWKRTAGNRRLPAGVGIELSKVDRRTRDLLADLAAGRDVKLVKRASRRFPVEIDLEYATATEYGLTGTTRDLSRDGAAIIGSRAPEVGTRLEIHMRPPYNLDIAGVVVWRQAADQNLFGVRFLPDDDKIARRVQRLINQVKQRIAEKRNG